MPVTQRPPSRTLIREFAASSRKTRRIYDLVSGIYPLSTMLYHSKAHRVALSLASIRDGMRVLEVATGSGEMLRRIAGVNPNGLTCGVDLSPNMAARTQRMARRRSPEAHCQAVDARSMPFHDNAFDAVVCCYLFELLSAEGIVSTLGEIHRVLRPRGRFSLVLIGDSTPGFNAFYRLGGALAPAFWGRQVAMAIPELIARTDFDIEHDRKVRQGFYPSRVIVARK
ncbi:MAG TPA: class I SAM-dependent methyltransferase [Bryobacteraceae bacterium]|jgi:ubiquinone/menaquinone biosynthesis C-methylase UbiE|nr:class I SAM-dependent methyltransferase [Bryobacteraceae bacterium]